MKFLSVIFLLFLSNRVSSFKFQNAATTRKIKIQRCMMRQTGDENSNLIKTTLAVGALAAIGFCGPAFGIGPTEVPLSNLKYKQVRLLIPIALSLSITQIIYIYAG